MSRLLLTFGDSIRCPIKNGFSLVALHPLRWCRPTGLSGHTTACQRGAAWSWRLPLDDHGVDTDHEPGRPPRERSP